MSKEQGQKPVKDVLRDVVLEVYQGKKKKRERSGIFFLFTASLWEGYLDDNYGAWLSRIG